MIERHYDEEALISLLESRREATDTHLPSCPPCTGKLASFRTLAGALRDADVWDKREIRTEAVPATIATLRAFADRMSDEDSRAEAILTELLAGSRETWLARLQEHPEWRTAGLARKLIESATRAIDTMPPDAVELTALATEVADHLDPSQFPSDTVQRLRGAAWRERAYALYYTGNYVDAEMAVFASESHFSDCVVNQYDFGRLGIVRAIVCRALDQVVASGQAAAAAARALEPFGDVRRFVSARLSEAFVLTKAKDFAAAQAILSQLVVRHGDDVDIDTRARLSSNLAVCYREMGNTLAALDELTLAAALFEENGTPTESARVSWNVALILVAEGRYAEAELRLRHAIAQFDELQMTGASAIAQLHLAELLLVTERPTEVEALCRGLIQQFTVAGISYSQRALTALSYLKEVALQRPLTKKHVVYVREYVAALPRNEKLLFIPLPE